MVKKTAKKAAEKTAKKAGTAVALHDPKAARAAAKYQPPATFLEFLDRAARDPGFDVAKFNAVLAAKEREDQRDAERRYDAAMEAAQAVMHPIRADLSNKQTKSNYASYPALDRAIRPIYSKHGFSVSFDTEETGAADTIRIVCYVSCQGFKKRHQITMPADGKGAKGGDVMTKTHATGSAVQYGRRYLVGMIFNVAVAGTKTDDDGNAASFAPGGTAKDAHLTTQIEVISDKQLADLQQIVADTGSRMNKVLEFVSKRAGYTVEAPGEIPAKLFTETMNALREAANRARK